MLSSVKLLTAWVIHYLSKQAGIERAPASLANTIIRGAGISTISTLFEKVLTIVQLVIVARLLTPEDFGVFALSVVLLLGLNTLTAIGTERMLIHRKRLTPSFISSVYLANILRGILVTVGILLTAPFYSEWMSANELVNVLLIVAWAPLVSGLLTPNRFLAEREFHFFTIARFQVVMAALGFMVVVSLAYYLRDVEALAWGQLSIAIMGTVISWLWFGFPKLAMPSLENLKELISVGKHYILIAIGTFVTTQADNLIIGSMLGTAVLGIYVLAYQLSQWPIDLQSKVVGKLLLPAFSSLHGDEKRFFKAFDKSLRVQSMILVPLCVGGAVLAEPLVNTVLSERYVLAVPVVQVLMFLAFFRSMSQYLSLIFLAYERVELASKSKLVESIAFVVLVWFGTLEGGMLGAAAGGAISYCLGFAVRLYFVQTLTQWSLMQICMPILPSIGASLLAGFSISLLLKWLDIWDPIAFVLLGFIYLGIFVGIMVFQGNSVVEEIRGVLLPKKNPPQTKDNDNA
ncbi:MAG TPA: hypothetical protein EYP39_08520 [Ghiorsea sp.]|nr:hypothetical protein [Ghiorsea sp.]HIP07546.1 hypothetical protein [Mariprofundaceae bacterium]